MLLVMKQVWTKLKFLTTSFSQYSPLNQIPHYQKKVPALIQPCLSDINVSLEGVYNLLLNINTHKTCGPDQIHGRVLKETADIISPFLRTLFQSSFDSQVIPGDCCSVNVTPLFKQGDKQQPSNYRPISVTSIVSKLFEQIINSNIMQHLEVNNIFK